jgi:hypothetical protein
MQLDHEFLADRRAALGFGAPETYASSLVDMAAPAGRTAAPPPRTPGSSADASSPLYQRVLMLVHCPYPVEQRPPGWWRWSLPILALVVTPAAAYLCLGLGSDLGVSGATATASPPPRTFQVPRLSLGPRKPVASGRTPAFELPLELPQQFDLTLEVWGNPTALAQCRVAGQALGPSEAEAQRPPETSPDPEAWHLIQLRRSLQGLSLTVDGHPVPIAGDHPPITSRLAIAPIPGRPTLVRNLRITW